MKHLVFLSLFIGTCFLFLSCGTNNSPRENEEENGSGSENLEFALGADISWVTEMESQGHKFYNAAGQERECTALMKECGLNAIRLRVWVDPSKHGGWCDVEDMVVKAVRAKDLGMDVMVDFHYSDFWADPSKQVKPAAWKDMDLGQLKEAIRNHTTEALQALKAKGVTPKWVQVGNEIRPGMLWDEDASLSGASWSGESTIDYDGNRKVSFKENWANLAAFINAGYDAVKSVFPQAVAIVHLDNGFDKSLYTWFFDELKKNGGKWDMIGMSLYPYWCINWDNKDADGNQYTDPNKVITDCIANIKAVSACYGCDVMVVETGMECADDKGNLASDAILQQGREQLARIIKECRENTGGKCKGVFYWEPECKPSQYRLGAFTADGKPTVIMNAFKD